MTNPSRALAPNGRTRPSELVWAGSEKKITRKAFDAALKQELEEVIQEAKQRAGQIKEPSELWDLEDYLTRSRKEINSKYDSRGSRLTHVLGKLLYEGRLEEEQLRGLTINARRRVEANHWNNVQVIEGDAKIVQLDGTFDAMLLLGAPDAYASPEAVDNLLRYLKDDARVVAFGAKLSHRRLGKMLNWLSRSLMKLSFSSTPELSYEPWCVLEKRLAEVQVHEYSFGCMFLAWGSIKSSSPTIDKSPQHKLHPG